MVFRSPKTRNHLLPSPGHVTQTFALGAARRHGHGPRLRSATADQSPEVPLPEGALGNHVLPAATALPTDSMGFQEEKQQQIGQKRNKRS